MVEIPVFFSDRKQFVKVEVQIRTMAMDFWASLEHQLHYKHTGGEYDEIVDEMWYIHTDIEIRSKRLAQSRQYSAERIANIMRGQLSEEEFRKHCSVVIINNGDLEETYKQINYIMGERV